MPENSLLAVLADVFHKFGKHIATIEVPRKLRHQMPGSLVGEAFKVNAEGVLLIPCAVESTEKEVSSIDFADYLGPYPVHRHHNRDGSAGGWVADTATIHGDIIERRLMTGQGSSPTKRSPKADTSYGIEPFFRT